MANIPFAIRAHYLGQFDSDADALAYIQGQGWDAGKGDTNPWTAMFYRQTSAGFRIWTGTFWEPFPSGLYNEGAIVLYNSVKARIETWVKCTSSDEFILFNAAPARMWQERFMAASILVPAALGLNLELPWAVNGRRNGANDPNENCFTAANEIGGGLSLNVLVGGQDNDYTAIHWDDNYPVVVTKSPHAKITVSPEQVTTFANYMGLFDNTRSAGQAAFALPDNGIFVAADTDVDNDAHFIIRSGGVEVHNTTLLTPIAGTHYTGYIYVSDDTNAISVVLQGIKVIDELDISGVAYTDLRNAQLQPYLAVVSRAPNTARSMHVHDFRIIMDRGF